MRIRLLGSIFSLVALSWALSATPAMARRTVIDASYIMGLSGYCSPGAAALDGCPALGNSVCNSGSITVIVNAQNGNILAWQGPTGEWKQP